MHLSSLTLFVSLSALYLFGQPAFCKPVPQYYPPQGYPPQGYPPQGYPPVTPQYPPGQAPSPSQPLGSPLDSVTSGLGNVVQLDLSKPATLPGLPAVAPLPGVPSGPTLPDLSGALGGAQQQD
ncbi:hypothetical protein BCV72DRAFT_223299 [Rhizopus microsporus var. microsporus]|uniref:Rhodopsin n=2 Tax=Rhizopus microsporus TaxID=58291 RepID=A0A2G4T0E1_RHIZD|nr:uncharacterized protein RHIMIDRAFT_275200 [Rhizopus microsporus ATCC 52813]ORE09415.1 hypothetical protein BCV72DRAFT_223299 [Rhizopus microsporus var. microsporus]PHZ14471.1 hypothetical protein RHIMIDRAFT_275200 [Rhizopus microsporus ATCC 52813]